MASDFIDDHYRKSPTFCQALRESTKRMLYVVANSSAMNGLAADDKIVLIMSWWEVALMWIDIVLGVLMVASAVMLVITIVKQRRQQNK